MGFLSEDYAPPTFRFIMELTSWIWMVLVNPIIAIISILSLALLNVPGDKKPAEEGVIGLPIPGKLRVLLEVITATLGLLFSIFSIPSAILQLIIVMAYLRYDTERLSWLWGWRSFPPEYVTNLHKIRAKKGSDSDK